MGHPLSVVTPYRKKWQVKKWAVVFAIALLTALGLERFRLEPSRLRPASPKAGVGWYLILKLPELPYNAVGNAAGRRRLEQWLDALEGAGYTPIFLSEAVARAGRGSPFPEKAVVLLYQPAYRQTVLGVFPILARHHARATLVTDQQALASGDTRFISSHGLRALQDQGGFDLGFYGASTMTFTLQPSRRSTAPQAELRLDWNPLAERNVLNTSGEPRLLNRLSVSLSWTGPQLLKRLAAETPIRAKTRLTATRLFKKQWGTTAAADAPFDMQSAADYRAATVTWNGLKGQKNLRVDIDAEEIMDELWVYLRYDRYADSGLRVGFIPKHILVEQSAGRRKSRLLSIPWSAPPDGRLAATITLAGTRLRVEAPGAPDRTVDLADDLTPRQALFQAAVFSKIHAVAKAKALRIIATPLPE